MATKFRKGQRVICTHYKVHPVVTITEVFKGEPMNNVEIWVEERVTKKDGTFYTRSWWGPTSWFKPIRKKIRKPRPITKPKGFNGLFNEGSLCDSGIPGCTCNQWASIAE